MGSAPPAQVQRPPENKPSPAPSAASAATAPPRTGKGPATFEDMGIPQGKQEGDCVSDAIFDDFDDANLKLGCHVNALYVQMKIWVAWMIVFLYRFREEDGPGAKVCLELVTMRCI